MSKSITIRIKSSDGTKRVELPLSATALDLYEKTVDVFSLDTFQFSLYKSGARKNEIISTKSETLDSLNVKHGDILYLEPAEGASLFDSPTDGANSESSDVYMPTLSGASTRASSLKDSPIQTPTESNEIWNFSSINFPNNDVVEDEVDQQLWKLHGKIQRGRDSKLCRHGANASCVHCSPLEPYDDNFLREQNIKHMSFHSYLRKLTAGVDRGKFSLLEDISCRIKDGCKGHLPWPKGICSKCQPNAVTLNRQVYRHVDNVVFENSLLVDSFLNYWRTSGCQRVGFLYGRYEIHTDVPLGIRAVVAGIYEPPQENTEDSIFLLEDDKKAVVTEIAEKLGLKCVGWIFTDLVAEDVQKGTVKCVRGIDSHFLSAQECITAGHFQNMHPNTCRLSPNGSFGSKFVTVCVTGDVTNNVHMEGYSVSNQCMALVRDEILTPTVEAPELGYVKESSDQQYVPDVYYKEKDLYGNEVARLARPLPVEYLLVDVPTATPLTPKYTLANSFLVNPFPIENRLIEGHVQDFTSLANYFRQFAADLLPMALSDFHVLLYLATNDVFCMKDYMDPLLKAIKDQDNDVIFKWLEEEEWSSLDHLMKATYGGGGSNDGRVGGHRAPSVNNDSQFDDSDAHPSDRFESQNDEWHCTHCTYRNFLHAAMCDMCGLPRLAG